MNRLHRSDASAAEQERNVSAASTTREIRVIRMNGVVEDQR
jgi:hypothetical protein